MIITFSGSLGSGKSTVAKIIAKKLGFEYLSTGYWFREMAQGLGMSVGELNTYAETHTEIDAAIDDRLKSYNDKQGDYVIDSRMAPYFIKDALRVRLVVSPLEGARRIFKDDTRATEKFATEADAIAGYHQRNDSEKARYMALYGVDLADESGYDLVVDTSNRSPEQVAEEIASYVRAHSV